MTHADKMQAIGFIFLSMPALWLTFILVSAWRKRLNLKAELTSCAFVPLVGVVVSAAIWLLPTRPAGSWSTTWCVVSVQLAVGLMMFAYLQVKASRFPEWRIDRKKGMPIFIVGWTLMMVAIRVGVQVALHGTSGF